MFKNIGTWSQKKLKGIDWCFNILYFLLTFIAPLITVIVMFTRIGGISEKVKISIPFIIVSLALLLAMLRFFKKAISRINILNIDGTYNNGARTTKHILELISKLILPLVVVIISVIFATGLQEWLNFYNLMIIICMSFFIGGLFIDYLILSFLDDEKSLRLKVAESNAINSRINLN